ncbi:hypothetical protein ABFA07_009610 [Porites harrisoni]
MALARAWMVFECLLAVFCILSIGVQSNPDGLTTANKSPTTHKKGSSVTSTLTTMPATSSSIKTTPTPSNHSTVPSPGNHSTVPTPGNHSTVPTPGNHSTVPTPGNHSTVPTPGNHSSTPTSKPGNHSSTAPTTNVKPSSVTPTPKGHHNSNGGSGSSSGKWVATGFAVLFGITTIVMTVLYCRQRKIYRELEGDSSLSRLI